MKKLLAILIAMLMVLSLIACTKNEDNKPTESDTEATEAPTEEKTEKATDSSSDDKNNNDDKKEEGTKLPETEDEIFKYVMDALKASEAYRGTMTISGVNDMSMNMTMGEETREQAEKMSSFISFDNTNKVMYYEDTNEDGEEKETTYKKTFYVGDKLYVADKNVAADSSASETSISIIHESSKEDYDNVELVDFFEFISEKYSGIKLANNFNEVKDAFNTAAPVLFNDMYAESFEELPNPTTTTNVTAKIANGVCTLAISVKSTASATMAEIMEATIATDTYLELSAKDGKIIEYKSNFEIIQKSVENDIVMQDYSQKVNTVMSVSYTFAKDKYDAFTATLPEDTSSIPVIDGPATEIIDVYCTVYANGVEYTQVDFNSDDTPQSALEQIINTFDNEIANVKVFTDEAMTKELTIANITLEDILALENAYLSVTPKDGFAGVVIKNSQRDEYSKPYKIVIPTLDILASSSVAWNEPISIVEPSQYNLDSDYVADESFEIWIDGVKQEQKPESITLEANKTYVIEYVEVLSEKQLKTN